MIIEQRCTYFCPFLCDNDAEINFSLSIPVWSLSEVYLCFVISWHIFDHSWEMIKWRCTYVCHSTEICAPVITPVAFTISSSEPEIPSSSISNSDDNSLHSFSELSCSLSWCFEVDIDAIVYFYIICSFYDVTHSFLYKIIEHCQMAGLGWNDGTKPVYHLNQICMTNLFKYD